MTAADLLGLVLLGISISLGLAVVAGGLLAFGEERLEIEADVAERGPYRSSRQAVNLPMRKVGPSGAPHGAGDPRDAKAQGPGG